jgi:hypothetical protein
MKEHFLEYAPRNDKPLLLMYDGHTTHVNQTVVDWAKKHNIILFVLPPHTSHILQPLDVGVFGPLKTMFYSQCQAYMRENPGEIVTRWNICEIICAIYHKAFSPQNLISAFRKTGIMPFNREAISEDQLAPHEGVTPNRMTPKETQNDMQSEAQNANTRAENISEPIEPEENTMNVASGPEPVTEKTEEDNDRSTLGLSDAEKIACILQNKIPVAQDTPKRSKRKPSVWGNLMNKLVSVSCNNDLAVIDSQVPGTSKATTTQKSETAGKSKPRKRKTKGKENLSPVAKSTKFVADNSDGDSEEDGEKCVVCKRWTPEEVRGATSIIFVKWANCDKCKNWCHLRYCTKVRVVRCKGDFLCPICDPSTHL